MLVNHIQKFKKLFGIWKADLYNIKYHVICKDKIFVYQLSYM